VTHIAEWGRVVENAFPNWPAKSIWAFSDEPSIHSLPSQGWKIHVSCTPANCFQVLESVRKAIVANKSFAKVVRRFSDIYKVNMGTFYGYSQVGKIFTIYPPNVDAFVSVGRVLAEDLEGLGAPSVPYDFAVPGSNCVFYRYGAFDDSQTIRSPGGELLPDDRYKRYAPHWTSRPFGRAEANDDE
jgi:hypothetical protein